MSLFLDAAIQWDSLSDTAYDMTIGHRDRSKTLHISFDPLDFDHLSGIHYATDIDFGAHRREYRGKKLIPALLSKKLDAAKIEKSVHWEKIADRLSAILNMTRILESDCSIYQFNPRKLPFHSKLSAAYLIYCDETREGIFLFLDEDRDRFYCKSVFTKDTGDYRVNQTKWTVLKKVKLVNNVSTTLYLHPSYKEAEVP